MMNDTHSKISLVSMAQARQQALALIERERNGIPTGLKSRYAKFNASMLKWCRPGVILIAGLSSSGKSTFVNNLMYDFTDKSLNSSFPQEVVGLYFNFETPSKSESLRTMSSLTNKSYAYLLSSEYIQQSQDYNHISDQELEQIKHETAEMDTRKIYYVDGNGNVNYMRRVVEQVHSENPDAQLVISIDHILLTRKGDENNDDEIIQNVAFLANELYTKYNAIVIVVHQLNTDIMSVERMMTPQLHYPVIKDIYRGSQIVWVCDDVFILHRPEQIGLNNYSLKRYPTKGLVHLSKLKTRFGLVGDIWLKNSLKSGCYENLTDAQLSEFVKKKDK